MMYIRLTLDLLNQQLERWDPEIRIPNKLLYDSDAYSSKRSNNQDPANASIGKARKDVAEVLY